MKRKSMYILPRVLMTCLMLLFLLLTLSMTVLAETKSVTLTDAVLSEDGLTEKYTAQLKKDETYTLSVTNRCVKYAYAFVTVTRVFGTGSGVEVKISGGDGYSAADSDNYSTQITVKDGSTVDVITLKYLNGSANISYTIDVTYVLTDYRDCEHPNAAWTDLKGAATDEKCVKYCPDCEKVVETKGHQFKYVAGGVADGAMNRCGMICQDCQREVLIGHDLKVTYKKLSKSGKGIPENSDSETYALCHLEKRTCKHCGYQYSRYCTNHTFKGNKCTACGYKREILTKVSSLKAVQLGTSTHTTETLKAGWRNYGGTRGWEYYGGGTKHVYTYKVKLSWKKKSKAIAYVYSQSKTALKAGNIATQQNNGSFTLTKKRSATKEVYSSTALTKTTFYVAPVNKYGVVGKAKKVTCKLQ